VVGLVCGLVSVASGCGGDGPSSPFVTLTPDKSFPGTPGDPARHASLFSYTPVPTCAVSNPTNLGLKTSLRIFRGQGVSDAELQRFLGGLARYYDQYGVSMSTAYDVITVPIHEAMILDLPAVSALVKQMTGVDINTTDPSSLPQAQQDQVMSATGRAIMNNMRELLRVYGMPRASDINVVILPAMVSDKLDPSLASFQGLLGLGFSPELLATITADDPARQLYDWLGVTDQFTPMATVGVGPIDRYLAYPDIAIAHEVGHAYGLVHTMTPGNLLDQGDITCNLTLDTDQLGAIDQSSLTADSVDVESLSLTARARSFVQAVERLVFPNGR